MTISVDAMGGDRAPFVVVEGAVEAAREYGHPLILVGDAELVEKELSRHKADSLPITVKHAEEVVGMDEPPSQAIRRKKKSSIRVAVDLVRNGEAGAFVSAGNTGACMAISRFRWGCLEGVERPAIAALLPTLRGVTTLLDVGATINCKAKHLVQFAVMGEVYTRLILKKQDPCVALLSIGEEEGKGNDVIREAFAALKRSPVNFAGNLDGKEVYQGTADVIVCDGFIGNVALKISESVAEMISGLLREELGRKWWNRLALLSLRPAFRSFKKTLDYSEYGGAPLLGVNGTCIIAHGGSSPKAIKNAIRVAGEFIEQRLNEHITEDLEARHELWESLDKSVPFWSHMRDRTRSLWEGHIRKPVQGSGGGEPS